MIASERKMYIMKCLNEKSIINLKEIAKELNIAEITVRRDFEKLEQEGKLKRVLGGAALEGVLDDAELTMNEKTTLNTDEKIKVAQFAAQFVKDGDCVFIDAGTTMTPLGKILAKKKIQIVTYNNLIIRNISNPVADIFLIGGKYLYYYAMNAGPVAQENLKQFNFDISFLGCNGLDLEKKLVFTTEMESLLMKKIALENSDKKYLLLDSSKFRKRGFLKFTEMGSFTAIICNNDGETENPYPESLILV